MVVAVNSAKSEIDSSLSPLKSSKEQTERDVDMKEPEESEEELNDIEKYEIWKKNTPCLYDMIVTNALTWPTLTVEFFRNIVQESDHNIYKLLIGTHTSGTEQESLIIGEIKLPTDAENLNYDHETGDYGGIGMTSSSYGVFQSKIRINHDREVNKARIMPKNPNVVATLSPSSKAYIFDITMHPSVPESDKICPQLILTGHSDEGFGLSWNEHDSRVLTGANDSLICLYDVESDLVTNATEMTPLIKYEYHTQAIGDVQWHVLNPNIFGSTSDDRTLAIWDTRTGPKPSLIKKEAHSAEINSLAFHHSSEYLLLTGSSDCSIKLWDIRAGNSNSINTLDHEPATKVSKKEISTSENVLSTQLHTCSFEAQKHEVLSVQWCPHEPNIFASTSGNHAIIWDLEKIGDEQEEGEDLDGPPELIFKHGGHISPIRDICWHLNDPLLITTVDDENVIQMWKYNSEIMKA